MSEFCAKIPVFYRRLQLADIQRGKFFSKSFSRKKVKKHLGNLSGIVSYIFLSMKTIVESQLNNSGRGKTERDVSKLCFLSELLSLLFTIQIGHFTQIHSFSIVR